MSKQWRCFAAMFAFGLIAMLALPAGAQNSTVNEKPRLYTYVALWELPRAQWGEWPKAEAADQKILQDAVANGTLVSYGGLAAALNQPTAARAVGSAVGQNPLAYLIPCHRVIRETGVIGDYRWGQVRKRAMLVWENSSLVATNSRRFT